MAPHFKTGQFPGPLEKIMDDPYIAFESVFLVTVTYAMCFFNR